jgi:circadian clock protein KaiC
LPTSRVRHSDKEKPLPKLEKALTGITGFDQITHGGLPKGRPTIVCGGPGCGKTMFAMEFLVRGATEFNEPGVLMTFEETGDEMTKNVASLGFDLKALAARKKIMMDYVKIESAEIQETGAYDLEGLFVRLQYAVDKIGAKRIVLDTLEAVFSGFSNSGILRAEIRRLFRWLKDRGLTTVVTAERGDGNLTRYGLEEYVSDCVIFLDHRVNEQVSTRRMRIVKYRGTSHGGDEYPFLIDEQGFSVLPSTSMRLDHKVSIKRLPSGVPDLDNMLEGEGFYKGSSILVSGTAGSGKSSLGASFAEQSCIDGRKTLYIAFEESPLQAARNMRSIGIHLEKHLRKDILKFEAWRPTQSGLEMHLLRIHKLVEEFEPEVVIIDPVSNLMMGNLHEVHSMLMRLVDFLKTKQITAMFTSLTQGSQRDFEQTEVGISSLIDTWILVRDVELSGERNRCIYILKSRGMDHSNQVREFVISSKGIRLLPVYIGDGVVLTGSARLAQEAREKDDALVQRQTAEEQALSRARRRKAIEAQIASLRLDLTDVAAESARFASEELKREQRLTQDRLDRSALRGGKSTLAGRAKRG